MFVLESRPTSELNFCANLCQLHSCACEERQIETLQFENKYFQKSDLKENVFIQGGHERSNF